MLALAAVTLLCLYLIGLRADRIHAQRTVRETVGSQHQLSSSGAETGATVSLTVRARYAGLTASEWHAKYQRMRTLAYTRLRHTRQLRRALLARPSVSEAINLAGATYGYTDTLWRKARCESGLDPNARNGSEASGLLQFLPSTWATTPYARFSVFSPYANALAAGWMHAQGRGGEWSCR